MALTLINDKAPHYTALSTDISLSKIAGLTYIGALVYILDTGVTYIVKDGAGTLGVYTPPAGSVSIGSIAAGENHIGEMGGKTSTVTVTPTLSVAGAYAAGDYIGTSATAMIFSGATRIANGSGIIHSAVLVDYALQSRLTELWLFDTAVTPPTDNAAWTISDANSATLIGVISFDTYYASAANSVATVTNCGIAFKAIGSDNKIYGCLVSRSNGTYANGDLTVRLSILQD